MELFLGGYAGFHTSTPPSVSAARSGDTGGNANVGLWARDAAGYQWLRDYLTVERLRSLLPEADGHEGPPVRAAQPARGHFLITACWARGSRPGIH